MTTTRIKALRQAAQDEAAAARTIAEKAAAEGRNLTADEQTTFDSHLAKAKGLGEKLKSAVADQDVIDEAHALAARIGGDPGRTGLGAGTTGHLPFTGTGAKALARGIARRSVDPESKALVTSGSRTTAVELRSEIGEMGRPPQSLLDILMSRTVGPTYSYLRQTVRTLNAAPVAEGATKPTSTVSVESVDAKLVVIAHVSEQIPHYTLSDNANLEQFVESELLFGLRSAVENQVINGTGAAPNLTGLVNTSGVQTQAFATDALTSVRKAITKLEAGGYVPSVLAISAADWEAIELLTATAGATDVRGVPVDAVARRLWGVQAVVSNVLPAKTALLLDNTAVSIDTDGVVDTRWSDAVATDFTSNHVRARCESRFGLSVFKPAGIVKIGTAA